MAKIFSSSQQSRAEQSRSFDLFIDFEGGQGVYTHNMKKKKRKHTMDVVYKCVYMSPFNMKSHKKDVREERGEPVG